MSCARFARKRLLGRIENLCLLGVKLRALSAHAVRGVNGYVREIDFLALSR